MDKRKIVYISGTRADFGLMSLVLEAIDKNPKLDLLLYATGMHLMPKFGSTVNEVKKRYPQTEIIQATFKNDTKKASSEFIADFSSMFIKFLKRNQPDLVLVLGDRVEMLIATVISSYWGLPIAHIHGGDKTTTIDDSARHAITKFAHIHFAASIDSAKRLKKLGEDDWRIHIVGAPSLDNILRQNLPSKNEVYKYLNIKLNQKYILLLQHPSTDSALENAKQIRQTLDVVEEFNLPVVVIFPNSDAGGLKIIEEIKKKKRNPNFRHFPNIEYEMFLGVQKGAAVWVGNSSGAIIESASFNTPVVNIGNRQNGRVQSGNVLNVGYNKSDIFNAINKSLNDKKYLEKSSKVKNVWGDGRTAEKIVKVLSEMKIDRKLLNKQITY